jgi:hypothetical protein
MANEGRRFRRRKKEDVWVFGYWVDNANDLMPAFDKQDESFQMFGKDSPDTDILHRQGTLSMGLLAKYENNVVLDLITGQDPSDSSAAREYFADQLTPVTVHANIKDRLNTKYVGCWIIDNWAPAIPTPTGDPNAKAQLQLSGNGDLPRQFQNVWLKTALVATGGGATLGGDTPEEVPGHPDLYAVTIKAIDTTAGIFEVEDVPVSADMVDNTGTVDFAAIEAVVQGLDNVTHAFVYYLQASATVTGVYPNIQLDGIRP